MCHLQTVVCVKHVKQEATEEWDENMPLPGDIVEGVAEDSDADDGSFVLAEVRSELRAHLERISRARAAEFLWLKVRRGDSVVKLQTCIVQDRNTKLPDQRSTIVSSVLFTPLAHERCIEAPTVRSMAWFSASVSSGVPLIFVNIQSEQILTREKKQVTLEELKRVKPQNSSAIINIAQGIRLWFLPGVAEVSVDLIPGTGESLFGMDMNRTEEGFICISFVTEGTAADRAGLRRLLEKAKISHHQLVVSRLQGKSLMPSAVDSQGLIHCCDNNDIKLTLVSAMEKADTIRLHVMSWCDKMVTSTPALGAASLRPPID